MGGYKGTRVFLCPESGHWVATEPPAWRVPMWESLLGLVFRREEMGSERGRKELKVIQQDNQIRASRLLRCVTAVRGPLGVGTLPLRFHVSPSSNLCSP